MSPSFLRGGIGLCFAISVIAARAHAQDEAPVVAVATVEPARLSYTAAPGCFDEETFHHAVASFMDKGRDPFDASAPVVLELPPGIFCSKLVYTMRDLFKAKYPNLGASTTL